MKNQGSTDSDSTQKFMSAQDASRVITELKDLGIKVTLDGGWGIDALLNEETRQHKDIDFLVEKKDVEKLNEYFAKNGFKQEDNFNKWWHQSYENDTLIIDIHVIEIDEAGKAIYGPKVRDDFPFPGIFPAYALRGVGKINGVEVPCLSAEYRVASLTRPLLNLMPDNYKYSPTKKDLLDLDKLCKKYDITLPAELANLPR